MTIYLDQYFPGGMSQQIGTLESIVMTSNGNLDIARRTDAFNPSSWETTVYSLPGKNARIRVDGFKQCDGREVLPAVLRIPTVAGPASLSLEQCMTIITSLVHMMGGAVSMDSVELDLAARKRQLIASQYKDPYRLQLNVTED